MNGWGGIFRRTFPALALATLSALHAADALAQCPLCRTAIDRANDGSARTMNIAILVLLIPPVSIFCSIFAVAYRKLKKEERDGER
jgi:hypothetical protein